MKKIFEVLGPWNLFIKNHNNTKEVKISGDVSQINEMLKCSPRKDYVKKEIQKCKDARIILVINKCFDKHLSPDDLIEKFHIDKILGKYNKHAWNKGSTLIVRIYVKCVKQEYDLEFGSTAEKPSMRNVFFNYTRINLIDKISGVEKDVYFYDNRDINSATKKGKVFVEISGNIIKITEKYREDCSIKLSEIKGCRVYFNEVWLKSYYEFMVKKQGRPYSSGQILECDLVEAREEEMRDNEKKHKKLNCAKKENRSTPATALKTAEIERPVGCCVIL